MDVPLSLREITVQNEGVINTTVVTGRSLFLNRFVEESRAGGKVGGSYTFSWRDDTYIGMLELTPEILAGWQGKRVLDVGSGVSFFGTEARALGITVDRVDLNVANVSLQNSGGLEAYCRNMARFSAEVGEFAGLFERIRDSEREIVDSYEADVLATRQADATNLLTIPTSSYDVSISIWMLAYLKQAQQKSVLREMIRVTRAGGQVRIHSGDTPTPFSRFAFRQAFESDRRWDSTDMKKKKLRNTSASEFVIADKSVTLNLQQSRTQQNLLVLDVAAYDPYYLYSAASGSGLGSAETGNRCCQCLAVHAATTSLVNHWHRCTVCNKLYCPTCGAKLGGKGAWYERERNCTCGGRTKLV